MSRRGWLPAVALPAVLMLPGCGDRAADGSAAPTPTVTLSPSPAPSTSPGGDRFRIEVTTPGAAQSWTLSCAPDGGTHPSPAAACAAAATPGAFDPPRSDVACTDVYGGPQTATITGTRAGQRIEASFTRTNGCAAAAWDALVPMLPDPAT